MVQRPANYNRIQEAVANKNDIFKAKVLNEKMELMKIIYLLKMEKLFYFV